jgi:hypothetical protein
MVRAGDGSILVATTAPAAGPVSFLTYYNGSGAILRFQDANADGVADGPATTVFSGLPGAANSLTSAGNLLVVATSGNGLGNLSQADLTILQPGVGGSFTNAGSIQFDFSSGLAVNMAVVAAPVSGAPGSYHLYFHLTATGHDGTPNPTGVVASGLVSGTLADGAIYRITLDTASPVPAVSGLTLIATGLRNSGGMSYDAATGSLIVTDNGFDANGLPVSADEIHIITASDLGNTVVNLGYPSTYVRSDNGATVGGGGSPPAFAFSLVNGGPRVGIAGVTGAPGLFPAPLRNGYFTGFHGDFALSGVANTFNPVVFCQAGGSMCQNLIEGGQLGLGNIDALMSDGASLFLADFAAGGFFQAGSGVLYQLTAIPEPSGMLPLALLVGLAWAYQRR